MKTLILVAHPRIEDSYSQQFLKHGALAEAATWHVLDDHQPYDIDHEQALLWAHDRIIFQFPLYWYSAPASLKAWQDAVLTRQFAYPSLGGALVGKDLGLAISLGLPEKNYAVGRLEQFSLDQLTAPFQAVANKVGMRFLPTFIIDRFGSQTAPQKQHLLTRYRRLISQPTLGHLANDVDWTVSRLQVLQSQLPADQAQRLGFVIEALETGQQDLSDLTTTLAMIRDAEDQ